MINPFINQIFLASLCSTLFVSVFVIFRKSLVKYLGARWNYYLWFIIFIPWFAVWLPFNFFPDISINFHTLISPLDMQQQLKHVSYPSKLSFSITFFIIWLTGALLYSFNILFKHFRFIACLKKSSQSLTTNQQKMIKNILADVNLISLDRIYLSAIISSPMICHIIQSKIYLPYNFFQNYSHTEQKYILQHECIHYQRCDLITNTSMLILICLNWFNPIILFSYRYFRGAQELACDSMLCQQLSSFEKKAYGYTLLKSASQSPSKLSNIACWWNAGAQLKERCLMLKYHHLSPLRNLFGLIVLLTTAGVALAIPNLEKWNFATDLTISNATFNSLTFTIDDSCSKDIGVINVMSIKTISQEKINTICHKNLSHCKAYVYQTNDCSGSPIAMLVIDTNQGVQTIAVYGHYNIGTGKNGFSLFFNGPWDLNQQRK